MASSVDEKILQLSDGRDPPESTAFSAEIVILRSDRSLD
jgi:hypothetical protein